MYNKFLVLDVIIFIIGFILAFYGFNNYMNVVSNIGLCLIGFAVIGPILFLYIDNKMQLNKMKTNIEQIKVTKKTALPIYRTWNTFFYLFLLIALVIVAVTFLLAVFENAYYLCGLFIFFFVAIVIYCIQRKRYKPFEIYKRSDDDGFTITSLGIPASTIEFSNVFNTINSQQESNYDIKKKYSEVADIQKDNEKITLWNITTHYHVVSDDMACTYSNRYIFAKINYTCNKQRRLLLTNNMNKFFKFNNNNNIITSQYSNLYPLLVNEVNEDNKRLVSKISKICSDFFAKTRFKYALTISENDIVLGLEKAKLGQFYRILNKEKTNNLIKEATNEIVNFLIELKSIIENVDIQ